MNTSTAEIHQADSRGKASHGWLSSYHTFSFASYYNPQRMGFGKLRVINDDTVVPSEGFGIHPHRDMEIISIPLKGALEHKDSMGNVQVIREGEVQIMSAGTGITHSEYNHSDSEDVNFLQIWVLPKELNIEPRYGQKEFSKEGRKNKFQLVISPDKDSSQSIWINQDAYFSLADLDSDKELDYQLHNKEHGVYIFLIGGSIEVADAKLQTRDGMTITGSDTLHIKAQQNSQILLMEVPL